VGLEKLKISVSSGIHVSLDMQLYTFCLCHKFNICSIGKIKNISFFRKSIRNAITNVYMVWNSIM